MWGLSIPFWETVFRWATISAFVLGGFTATAAFVSAWVGYELSDIVQKDADKRIAEAKADAGRANEASEKLKNDTAKLDNETARLTAENLALQTVLLPRHVGLFGINEEPKAKTWFANFERWAGTKLLIQVVAGDPEAQHLANEIAHTLSRFGWFPEFIDQKRSGLSLNSSEGVTVLSPNSHKAWDEHNAAQQTFAKLAAAQVALAAALTDAGLGVGPYPVPHGGIVVDFPPDSDAAKVQYGKFDPPLDGVYLQVGSRPVTETLQWIRHGRPDAAGVRAPNAIPAEPQK